jgi:hypothetical protein
MNELREGGGTRRAPAPRVVQSPSSGPIDSHETMGAMEQEGCIGDTSRDLLTAGVSPMEHYCFGRDLLAFLRAAIVNVRGDGHARAGH